MDTEQEKVTRDTSDDSENTGEHNSDTIEITSSDENKNDVTPKVCVEIEEKRAVS